MAVRKTVKRKEIRYVRLGADPEFEVWVPRRGIVNASAFGLHFLPRIGRDGAGLQVEFRPQPTFYAAVLWRRIRKMASDFEELNNVKLLLSGHKYPLGCHLHVSSRDGRYFDSYEAGMIVRSVDRFPTPLGGELGDILCELSGRARGGYKAREAFENGKRHNGFEYRTPPAIVLLSPRFFTWLCGLLVHKVHERLGKESEFKLPFPTEDVSYLMSLVQTGDYIGFDEFVIRLEHQVAFELSALATWDIAWFNAMEEWNANSSHQTVIRLVGAHYERGLVTNHPGIAQKYGWKYDDDLYWRYGPNIVVVPFEVRYGKAWSRQQVKEFFEFVSQLVTQNR